MSPTPSSEQSVYFDAPIAIFSSKSQPNTTTMNTTAPNEPHMPQPSHATPPNGYLGLNHNAYDNSTQTNTNYNRNVTSPLSGGVGGESILSNHPYSPPPQGMGNGLPAGATTQHPAAESAGWLPAVDEPLLTASQHAQANGQGYQGGSTNYQGAGYGTGLNRSNTGPSRTLSRGSAYYSGAQSLKRGGSTHSRKSFFTDADGAPVHGSMFIGGAATTGPKSIAERDPELLARSQSADEKLTPKQRQKAQKAEAKENKRLSKVIKQEGKVEKIALGTAIKELANLQKIQNEAVKNEAKANAMHAKILADFQKEESVFLAARTRFEAAQARLHTQTENVEIVRNNAREATEQLQEKSREIDGLRAMLLLDEKERTVKLNELKMKEAAKNNSKPAKATSTPPPRLATPTPASQ